MSSLTNGEARSKYCPFTRDTDGDLRPCKGSSCAVWRWHCEVTIYPPDFTVLNNAPHHKEPTKYGYCGMASKPEEYGNE